MVCGRLLAIEAVDGAKEGAGAYVWVEGGERRRRDFFWQREVGRGAEFAAVVRAVAAEEDVGDWRDCGAAEGT